MGEARRRKSLDPDFGLPKSYMSYLELPYTEKLVRRTELRNLLKTLKNYAQKREFYSTVIFDHTERWQKIENLCSFIGMEQLISHNPRLYNTSSIFASKSLSKEGRERLISYYKKANEDGFPNKPPEAKWIVIKQILEESHNRFQEFIDAGDIICVHQSKNCAAFYIPSDIPFLAGLGYVEFFTRLQLQSKP